MSGGTGSKRDRRSDEEAEEDTQTPPPSGFPHSSSIATLDALRGRPSTPQDRPLLSTRGEALNDARLQRSQLPARLGGAMHDGRRNDPHIATLTYPTWPPPYDTTRRRCPLSTRSPRTLSRAGLTRSSSTTVRNQSLRCAEDPRAANALYLPKYPPPHAERVVRPSHVLPGQLRSRAWRTNRA